MRKLITAAATSLLLLLMLLSPAVARAGEPLRPVTTAWTVEAGSAHLTDSYLSPLHYSGQAYGLGWERFQAMRFDPRRWVMRLEGNASVADTENPARNATMWDLSCRLSWGMMRRWQLPHGLTLALGGSTGIDAGALVLRRNSNNPASVKAAWTVNLTGMALWRCRLAGRGVTLRWQPTLPLLGLFFSPQYGELYYEMYLGDRSGLVHVAWPGSRAAMENLVTADWRLGATALRLGYRGTMLTSEAGGLVTRRFVHMFILGVSLERLSINPSKTPSHGSEMVSAYY